MTGPVEQKVKASTAAAVVAGFVDWLLATYVFHGNSVPEPVQAFVLIVVAAVLTFGAGYFARHTPRKDISQP